VEQNADVICLQEVRATDDQLATALGDTFDGWHLAHRPSAVCGPDMPASPS
jgi:exodeoxyribonuclease-3